MANEHFNQIEGQCSMDVFKTTSLLTTWLEFLDAAGNYAKRYYLRQDLEQEAHSPRSDRVLADYYGGDLRTLRLVIKQDLSRMEQLILKIREHQLRLGLGGFKVDGDSLSLFIDFFSIMDRQAPKRRDFYRRKIRQELKKPMPTPLTLDELEFAFKTSKSYYATSPDSP